MDSSQETQSHSNPHQDRNMSLDSHDLEVFGILSDIKEEDQSEHIRKRRKTEESPEPIYWNDYTKVWVEVGDPPIMKLEGMCKHCGTFISVDSRGCGVNALKNHAASCLKRLAASKAGKSQTVKANTSLSNWKFDQMAIKLALCEMIMLEELPFSFVEHEGFGRFVQLLCPRFHIPERHDIRTDCVRLFHKHKQNLRKFFQKEGMGRVSITSDCWTALDNTNFICISAHCIGKDWKLYKKIINFCKVESHNASAIGDSIVMSLQEWGLTNLFSCTVDNTSANEEAVRHVKRHLDTLNKDILDGKYFHMRCATHILSLAAQDSLEEIDISVRRVREAIKWLKNSPHRGTQWDNILNLFTDTIDCKKSLCLDAPTRWDSTYLMLESALPYEEAFKLFGSQHSCFVEDLKQRKQNDLSIGPPEKEDWVNVKNMMEYLRKIHALTHVFSATKYPTSHLFFAEMCDFFDLISVMEISDDSEVSAMARKMRLKIGKYWSEETELNPNLNRIMYIAAVLDPRQKMKHVEKCFKTIYGVERGADMVKEVTDSMNELFEFYRVQNVTPTLPRVVDTSTVIPRNHVRSNHRVALSFMALQYSDDEETSDANELTVYLRAKRHMVSMAEVDNFDILKWWSEHPHYHVLSRMARDILAIPISCVASEYAFSTGGDWLKISNMELKDKEDVSEEEQQNEFQRVLATMGEIAQKRNA